MSEHTPTPWRFRVMGSDGCRIFPNCEDKRESAKFIAMVNGRDLQTDTDNAAFIVRACNAHEALVGALDGAWQIIQECKAGRPQMANFDYVETVIKPVLALARGEVPNAR